MAFTYDSALADDISRIRQLINDTIESNSKFEDEALTYYLSISGGSVFEASALALEQLSRKYSLIPDVQLGTKRMSGSAIASVLALRAAEIRGQASGYRGNPPPYTAGVSVDEFYGEYQDVDIPKPVFGFIELRRPSDMNPEVD